MTMQTMNRTKRITLTIEAASREVGCSRTKLSARLADVGTKPDADGKFTLKQICEALFGSAHTARLREATARAELVRLEAHSTAVIAP